jgi:hypothetical protein
LASRRLQHLLRSCCDMRRCCFLTILFSPALKCSEIARKLAPGASKPTRSAAAMAREARNQFPEAVAAAGSLRYSKQDELLYEEHNIVSLVRTSGPTRKMKIPDLVQPALALILLALITGKQLTHCCVRFRVLTKAHVLTAFGCNVVAAEKNGAKGNNMVSLCQIVLSVR